MDSPFFIHISIHVHILIFAIVVCRYSPSPDCSSYFIIVSFPRDSYLAYWIQHTPAVSSATNLHLFVEEIGSLPFVSNHLFRVKVVSWNHCLVNAKDDVSKSSELAPL